MIRGALWNSVPFAQFIRRKKRQWRNVTTYLKVTLRHECFLVFLTVQMVPNHATHHIWRS